MTAVIGIDPGQGGGIALLEDGVVPSVFKMPETERDIYDLIRSMPAESAYIEQVHSTPQMGVASSFKFGVGYGGLRMALIAIGTPFSDVTPAKWQQVMRCRSRGDKNVTKRRAQELFPDIKMTHALADALLIAAFGYREQTGKPWSPS